MTAENSMGTSRIPGLILKTGIPLMLSLLINSLYNFVDSIFVSQVAEDALTALSLAAPVQVLVSALGLGNAVGLNAAISKALGEKKPEEVRKTASAAIFLAVCAWILISAACLLGVRRYFDWQSGGNETIAAYGRDYLSICMLFSLGQMGQWVFDRFVIASGKSKLFLFTLSAASVTNLILDPVFIFVFKWGMMGAAVATVLGQLATAVLAVFYIMNMKSVKPSKSDFRMDGGICRKTLVLGATSFLSQISLVAAMAAINNMIRRYGALDPVFGLEQYAQIPMAVVGIVMKFFQIVISIVVGMAAGCIPVVGFNMGAGKWGRVRELFQKLLAAEASVGAAGLIIVELFPRQLINIFGAANESVYYTDFAIRAFRIYLCMMIFACVNKACFIFLQAMGKPVSSTLLSMIREIVFGVGFALLLPVFFGLDGVLYSMPLSDILTFAIALFLILQTFRELSREEPDSGSDLVPAQVQA